MNDLIRNKSACDKDVDITEIVTLLPRWKTHILKATIIDKEDFPKLSLRFLLRACTEEEIKKWLAALQETNKTTYSIHCTAASKGKYVNFKQRLICHHNTRSANVYEPSTTSRPSTKNTNCPSRMTVVLHAIKRRYQGKDRQRYELIRKMPCEVTFIATHNHDNLSAFRKPSAEVKEKLMALFHRGHSPKTALDSLKAHIRVKYENYQEILADRKHCPTYQDCYHLYNLEFLKMETIKIINIDVEDTNPETEDITPETEDTTPEIEDNSTAEIEDSPEMIAIDRSVAEASKALADAILTGIHAIFTQFIDASPVEAAAALGCMYDILKETKDPVTFASHCKNFGSAVHRRNQDSTTRAHPRKPTDNSIQSIIANEHDYFTPNTFLE